jgi:hypothetical protein
MTDENIENAWPFLECDVTILEKTFKKGPNIEEGAGRIISIPNETGGDIFCIQYVGSRKKVNLKRAGFKMPDQAGQSKTRSMRPLAGILFLFNSILICIQ